MEWLFRLFVKIYFRLFNHLTLTVTICRAEWYETALQTLESKSKCNELKGNPFTHTPFDFHNSHQHQ